MHLNDSFCAGKPVQARPGCRLVATLSEMGGVCGRGGLLSCLTGKSHRPLWRSVQTGRSAAERALVRVRRNICLKKTPRRLMFWQPYLARSSDFRRDRRGGARRLLGRGNFVGWREPGGGQKPEPHGSPSEIEKTERDLTHPRRGPV